MAKSLASIVAAGAMALGGYTALAQDNSVPNTIPTSDNSLPKPEFPKSAYAQYWTDYEKYPVEDRAEVAADIILKVFKKVCDGPKAGGVGWDKNAYFFCEQTQCRKYDPAGSLKCLESEMVSVFVRWADAIKPTVDDPLPAPYPRVIVGNNPEQYIQTPTLIEANSLKYAIQVVLHEHKKQPQQTNPNKEYFILLIKP